MKRSIHPTRRQPDNSIAKVKSADGKPCRVSFKHPLKGNGFLIRGMNVKIVEHKY